MKRQAPSSRPAASLAAGNRAPEGAPAQRRDPSPLPAGAFEVRSHAGGPELIDPIEHDWQDLCSRTSDDPWYRRPEWVRAYVTHFAAPGAVRLVTAWRGGTLHAVLPLLASRVRACGIPARRLRSAADYDAWRFDMARAEGEPGSAALAAIVRRLPAIRGWDYLDLRDVPEGGAAEELASCAERAGLALARVDSLRTPYLSLAGFDGDPEFCLKRVAGSFRSNMRRAIKAAGSDVRLERIESLDPEAFERFVALEASGWKGQAGTSLADTERALAYHRALFTAAERAGDFAMKFVWVGGKLVAAACAIERNGHHVVIKGARDDSHKKLSPGHLLVHLLLLDCAERGTKVFDFAGVDEKWKLAWKPEILRHHNHYIFRKGLYGRALHTAMFKVSPAIKRLLRKPDATG